MRFGEAFKQVREDRDVGLPFVASRIGVTDRYLRYVEAGVRLPLKPSQLRAALKAMQRLDEFDRLWSLAVLDRVLRVAPELEGKVCELKALIERIEEDAA